MDTFSIVMLTIIFVILAAVFVSVIVRLREPLWPLFYAIGRGIKAIGRGIGRFFAWIGSGIAWIAEATADGFCALWRAMFSRKRKKAADTGDKEDKPATKDQPATKEPALSGAPAPDALENRDSDEIDVGGLSAET